MRKPIIASIVLATVTVATAVTAMPYVNGLARRAQAAQFTSAQHGAFAVAPTTLPLLSRPKPAVETTQPAPAKKAAAKAEAKPAPKPARTPATKDQAAKPAAKRTSRQAEAERILAGLIRQHPILKGTTVRFGSTTSGAQAEAFYKSGRIVVSPSHRASLKTILTHEVWHVIDWRADGEIDWGERIPPRYPRSY